MSKLSWGIGPTQHFFQLTPDAVMTSLESHFIEGQKRQCTGYCQPLASFENRVYEVEFDEPKSRAVAKFYRPGRWNQKQIQEEHDFMADLLAAEVPVVVPMKLGSDGETLAQIKSGPAEGLFYCVYPKVGGRQPEDLPRDRLQQLGRLIARMHTVGKSKEAQHRIHLTPENYGEGSVNYLKTDRCVPEQSEARFFSVCDSIVQYSKQVFRGQPIQRLHGDCHSGNILWNEKTGPFFIDFDDMVVGPPIQDLWLLAPDPENLKDILDGYHQWTDLPMGSLRLVEPLRALRMIHYATWIAKRFDDPAFQRAFPHFASPRYWDELTLDLERQWNRIQEEEATRSHG